MRARAPGEWNTITLECPFALCPRLKGFIIGYKDYVTGFLGLAT